MAKVTIRFYQPQPALARFVSTYYLTEVAGAPGEQVADHLHPEWANLRYVRGTHPLAAIGDAPIREMSEFIVAGPTSRACQFVAGTMRAWGIGLLPLGWARFVGVSAQDYADRFVDGNKDSAFAPLAGLCDHLCREPADIEADPETNIGIEIAAMDNYLAALLGRPADTEELRRIDIAHAALIDPEVSTVAQFSERVGMSQRTAERLSCHAFGFPPKLLLRRQRFLRSLAQFMLDPSMRWINTLDSQYYDQAHFARDFNRFMGMTARDYARLDHPILSAAAFARMASTGAAMQVLHRQSD